jgi:hypothetical protein
VSYALIYLGIVDNLSYGKIYQPTRGWIWVSHLEMMLLLNDISLLKMITIDYTPLLNYQNGIVFTSIFREFANEINSVAKKTIGATFFSTLGNVY